MNKNVLFVVSVIAIVIVLQTGAVRLLSLNSFNYFLVQIICALEDSLYRKLTFTVVPEQPLLGGTNSKYLLQDNYHRFWLFKYQENNSPHKLVCTYRFGKYCNFNIPEIHEYTIVVNEKTCEGTLQRYFPETKNLYKLDIAQLKPPQIDIIAAHQIFDFFIYNFHNVGLDFLINEQNDEVIFVDKDRAFGLETKDTVLADTYLYAGEDISFYNRMWDAFKKGTLCIRFSTCLSFLNYLEETDWFIVEDLFGELSLDEGTCLFENIDILKERKNTIKNECMQFYTQICKKRGENMLSDVHEQWYAYTVFKRLIGEFFSVARMYVFHFFLKENKEPCRFNMIESHTAWRIIKEDFLPLPASVYDLDKLITRLSEYALVCTNPYESMAVKLYLERCWLLKKQGQTYSFDDLHMLMRISQYPGHFDIHALTALYGRTRLTHNKLPSLTSYYIGRQLYAVYQEPADIVSALNAIESEQREYCLKGFLDASLSKHDSAYYVSLFSMADEKYKALIAQYIGRNISSFSSVEEIIKEARIESSHVASLYYGFGISLGSMYHSTPDIVDEMMHREDKSQVATLYPGFGMGFVECFHTDYEAFYASVHNIPPLVRFHCFEALGKDLLFTEHFNMAAIEALVSRIAFSPHDKRIVYRGLGQSIMYWYYFEDQKIADLIFNVPEDIRNDMFKGGLFYLTRQLLGTSLEINPDRFNKAKLVREGFFR